MKSSQIRHLLFPLLVFLPFAFSNLSAADVAAEATPKAPAASSGTSDGPLVIKSGFFPGKDGTRTRATIRNLIDWISQRYPDTNITVVGVEDVVIENLALQWRRTRQPAPEGEIAQRAYPPLEGLLVALSEASGRKFYVRQFGPNDFVLALDFAQSPPQTTEVFNLSPLMGARNRPALLEEIQRGEIELGILQKNGGPTPGSNAPHIAAIQYRIEVAKKLLSQSSTTAVDVEKLIEKIQTVAVQAVAQSMTLRESSNGRSPSGAFPQFKYHPGTNLLVVVGSPDAIDITRKVIAALEKNP